MRRIASLLCLAAAAAAADGGKPDAIRARTPSLTSVFPQGWQPGTKLRVEVLGEYLDRAREVVFLDPAVRGRVVEGSYTRLVLQFDIAADAAFGPHYFRVVSPRGASNIVLFRVGDQPHILEREPNTSLQQAQPVAIPATINGRLDVDGDFDFYRFQTKSRAESWIFDLRSARNGNGLDPALILLDAQGRELAHSEDVFVWDPFIRFTFPEPGVYYAVVQPTHVRLDPNFAYQLDIRQAPHVETISPISLAPGAAVEATIFGAGLAGSGRLWFDEPGLSGEVLEMRGPSARVRIRVPADAPEGPRQLAVINEGGRSNPATFLVDPTPAHQGGAGIAPPVSITGIARYRQAERFWFEAAEKQKLVFEVRAQRFGSPVDSILRLLDEKGKELAMNDDANFPGAQFNKDSRISYTFSKPGRYQVEIRNLWKTTGEDFPYQLIVRPPRPEAGLMLTEDHPAIHPGGKATLKVKVDRRDGFDGPLALEVAGLPDGVKAAPGEIPAGNNEGAISLEAGEVPVGTHAQVRITAAGAIGPAWQAVKISSGGGEGATYATVREATLAVSERAHFSLEAAVTTLNLVRGGSAEFSVAIKRARDFPAPIQFSFENLPPGVSAENTMAGPGSESIRLRFRAAADAPKGRWPRVAILGHAEGGETQEAPRVGVIID